MHRAYKFLTASIVSIGLGIFSAGLASADINIPAGVGLSEPIYFMTPGGEPIQVPAGLYHVDTAEHWLALSPIGGTRVDAIVIEATNAPHDEALSTERAFFMATSKKHPELKSLLLYRPDGTAFEAVGSQTGVWSRGLKSMFKNVRNKIRPAAKVTRNVSKDLFRHAQRTGKQVFKRLLRPVDTKRVLQTIDKVKKKERKITQRIMKSKNQVVDAVVKMMNANFRNQRKVMGAVMSRGIAPKVSVEECTDAAKSAITQVSDE